jgi:SAM-dependent methyltransferase
MNISNASRLACEDLLSRTGEEPTCPTMPGHCPICGEWSYFYATSMSLRESLICQSCFSTSRYRRIAKGLLQAIDEITGVSATSLSQLPAQSPSNLRVFDTNPGFLSPPYAGYAIPGILAELDWIDLSTSSFNPDLPWGKAIGTSVTNQNLEALTYDSATFDIVITSDVLEHVRLYKLAHAEIARVVKPSGVYLFTVPHGRTFGPHLTRVLVKDPNDQSRDEHLLPAEYHGTAQPGEGPVLSYRVFGTDIDVELRQLGFSVNYSNDPMWVHAIFETELFYCRRQ